MGAFAGPGVKEDGRGSGIRTSLSKILVGALEIIRGGEIKNPGKHSRIVRQATVRGYGRVSISSTCMGEVKNPREERA